MHMQTREFFGNSTDMIFELYHEPLMVVPEVPEAVAIRPFNWSSDIDTTVIVDLVTSFSGGDLSCRNKVYGEQGVGNRTSGGDNVNTQEINFPANSVLGVKVFRDTGSTGEAKCTFRVGWYEHGEVV